MAALSWPGHYQAPWMPVFSSFVGRGIDSHSPGNDCHTSVKSQPPTGPTTSNEAVKGPCSWTVATNTSWSSPTAQQQTPTAVLSATASTEKRCTARTSFPLLTPPQVVLVLTPSLLTHKGPLKCLRMLYGCMTRRRLTLLGVRKYTSREWIHIVLLLVWGGRVTLELICMRFELQKGRHSHFQSTMTSAVAGRTRAQDSHRYRQLQITLMEICSLILYFFT